MFQACCVAMFLLLCCFFYIPITHAQQGMSLTIAPPLFQVNLQPGETWSSSIAVVNDNAYEVTLFADPVLFQPSGESGSPIFFLPDEEKEGMEGEVSANTIAEWIILPEQSFTISREQTHNLPFTITVPEDAAPGGHYAAILIGNRPQETSAEGSTVNVTSSIATLIFLSVSGDVMEKGRIRDFSTEKMVYEDAKATLSLRFENQGNVHLIPQGNIVIYNMFGKVRGVIPLNQHKYYGNVLPESIRKFTFVWESDSGLWDIGRYKAEATVGYGKDQKQQALATTFFYVLPIVPMFQVIGSIVAFVLFVGWAIRAYIRRALTLEYQQYKTPRGVVAKNIMKEVNPRLKIGVLVKPIQVGLVDLRHVSTISQYKKDDMTRQNKTGILSYISTYRMFFFFIIIFSVCVFGFNLYVADVLKSKRDYSVSEMRHDGNIIPLSETQ